ncbi:MAG: hypothetical protein J5367_08055 [Lachnospiraceae bacterium]|nr:hypothetical protein [Lachnospiraceae bacterium]
MKNRRFVCFFFSVVIGMLSIYFSYPQDVYASNNGGYQKWDWSHLDPDYWGKGKGMDECTEEQKAYRRNQIWWGLGWDVCRGLLNVTGAIASTALTGGAGAGAAGAASTSGLGTGFQNWLIRSKAIADGETTYSEYMIHEAGLDYLCNTQDPKDLPTSGVNFTYSPSVMNNFQSYIKETNEKSTGYKTLYVADVESINKFGINDYASATDAQIGTAQIKQNWVRSKTKYNHPVIDIANVNISYTHDNGSSYGPANSKVYAWLDGNWGDYAVYCTDRCNFQYYNGDPWKYGYCFGIKKLNGSNITLHLAVYDSQDCKMREIGDIDIGGSYLVKGCCNQIQCHLAFVADAPFHTPYNNTANRYSDCVGIFYNTNKMLVYSSIQQLNNSISYGTPIPPIIQSSGSSDTIYDNSVTINGDEIKNYDYSTVVYNIGDTTGMSPEEMQQMIDSVLAEMGAIGGDVNDIKENTEFQVSWLKKIYDKLCDVYDKMGGGLSLGQVFEWEWLQVKLDAIIALLGIQVGTELVDDVTDEVAILGDIGTDIGEALTMKFPFCLPWDMMLILNALKSVPETPVFEIPFSIPSWGVDTTFTLDLSDFQTLSNIAKWFFDILYGFAITKLTLKILQVQIVGTSG